MEESKEIEMALSTLTIPYAEFIIISFISIIGGIIHEYITINKIEMTKFKLKESIINLFLGTTISNILCFVINPFIMKFSVRLVLLPPLIFGLIGPELALYMVRVKSATKIISWIVSLITHHDTKVEIPSLEEMNGKDKEVNTKTILSKIDSSENNDSSTQEESINHILDVNSEYLLGKMQKILKGYITNPNDDLYKNEYLRIKKDLDDLHELILQSKSVDMDTALRISQIIQIKSKISQIYEDIDHDK